MPFLLASQYVTENEGWAVVCAVGQQTQFGSYQQPMKYTNELSPLQTRMQNTTEKILPFSALASLGVFIFTIMHTFYKKEIQVMQLDEVDNWFIIVDQVLYAFTILLVTLPDNFQIGIELA